VPLILYGAFYYIATKDLLGGKRVINSGFEDIEIYEGEMGVKLIDAQTFDGAIYGLGFVHARDRLWQMHMIRMIA